MRRVVVAGGGGFIGSHLCDALLARGAAVVCVDSFVTGDRSNLAAHRGTSAFTLIESDICALPPIAGPVDAVLNLASPASPTDFDQIPIEILDTGSLGTRNLLDLAVAKKARFLQASTSEVYGDPAVHPQPESYWGNVDPVGPRSCYDEAKRFGEALVSAYARVHGLDTRIARIFNTYGPRMRVNDGRVVINFCAQALRGEPITVYGDGSQTRSLCYVDDLVAGLIRLLESDVVGPCNLGSDAEFTMLELAELVRDLAGSSSPIEMRPMPGSRIGDPMVRRPDLARAHSLLGYESTVSAEVGIRRVLDDLRRRG